MSAGRSLRARIGDTQPEVRAAACREASEDPAGTLYAEALIVALCDGDRTVRQAASDALLALARRDPAVAALVRQALRSESSVQRRAALEPARRLGPPEPGWLPAIVEAMASAPRPEAWAAARTLVELAHRHPETHAVAAGLARSDERARVRRLAILCVHQLDPGEPETSVLLREALDDPEPEVRRAASLALAAAGREATGGPRAADDQKTIASSE